MTSESLREYAEHRIHCHRDLREAHLPSGVACESDAQEQSPTGGGLDHPSPRTPVGSGLRRLRRSGMDCSNCGAPEGVRCQPFCLAEQIS